MISASLPSRSHWLTKAGRLTPEERMLIEQHPELGYQALRKLGTTHDWLAEVVRQAHERWNGQGYPNKLKGRQINEFAQIIGVVDVFDALVSPRPYRRRFLPHEAVRELVVVERTAFPRKSSRRWSNSSRPIRLEPRSGSPPVSWAQ